MPVARLFGATSLAVGRRNRVAGSNFGDDHAFSAGILVHGSPRKLFHALLAEATGASLDIVDADGFRIFSLIAVRTNRAILAIGVVSAPVVDILLPLLKVDELVAD